MAQIIEIGTILIKEDTHLPQSLHLQSDPYLKGWRLVKNLSGPAIDLKLSGVGWSFFFMAGEENAMAFGSDLEKTTRRAVAKVITHMKSGSTTAWKSPESLRRVSWGCPASRSLAIRDIFRKASISSGLTTFRKRIKRPWQPLE